MSVLALKDQILSSSSPTLGYRGRGDERSKHVLHLGQRKLLLSEIQFFTKYLDENIKNPIVIYAGAAPGNHIPILSELFPQLTFHLYDPSEFKIQSSQRIKIMQTRFTDLIAMDWAKRESKSRASTSVLSSSAEIFIPKEPSSSSSSSSSSSGIYKSTSRLFFISDIRTAGPSLGDGYSEEEYENEKKEIEKEVAANMRAQERWTKILKPREALLKMRLPYAYKWAPKYFDYLQGICYLQTWPRPSSTETRLVPIRDKFGNFFSVSWDVKNYEDMMAYHNVQRRENEKYLNPFNGLLLPVDGKELTNDYDSISETMILMDYVARVLPTVTYRTVVAISRFITSSLMRNNIASARLEGERMEEAKKSHPDLTFSAHVVAMSKLIPGCVDYSKFKIVRGSWHYCLMPHQIQLVNENLKRLSEDLFGGVSGVKLIFDGTGHVGCDAVNLATLFKEAEIVVTEIDVPAFRCLEKNVHEIMGDQKSKFHLIRGDVVTVLRENKWRDKVKNRNPIDILYIDPPWGGKSYRDEKSIQLTLSGTPAENVIVSVIDQGIAKVAILKAPFNFDFRSFSNLMYQKGLQNNIKIVPIWIINPDGTYDDKSISYYHIVIISPKFFSEKSPSAETSKS